MDIRILLQGDDSPEDLHELIELRDELRKAGIPAQELSRTGVKDPNLVLGIAGLAVSSLGTVLTVVSLWKSQHGYSSFSLKSGSSLLPIDNLPEEEVQEKVNEIHGEGDSPEFLLSRNSDHPHASKRIAFVVNALTGNELSGGNLDSVNIFRLLALPELGGCETRPGPLHECADRTKFEICLTRILNSWKSQDQLIFYFSGHGIYRHDQYCLVFGEDQKSFYTSKGFLSELKASGVSRAILIIDACYSGATINNKETGESREFKPNSENVPPGMTIIASSRSNQRSHELPDGSKSVFTHLLCRAIEGGIKRESTRDGRINVEDAVTFINNELRNNERYSKFSQTATCGGIAKAVTSGLRRLQKQRTTNRMPIVSNSAQTVRMTMSAAKPLAQPIKQ